MTLLGANRTKALLGRVASSPIGARLSGMVGVNVLGVLLGAAFVAVASGTAGVQQFGHFAGGQAIAQVCATIALGGSARSALRTVASDIARDSGTRLDLLALCGGPAIVAAVLGALGATLLQVFVDLLVPFSYVVGMSALFASMTIATDILRGTGAQVFASVFAQPTRLLIQIVGVVVADISFVVTAATLGIVNVLGVGFGFLLTLRHIVWSSHGVTLERGPSARRFLPDISIWRTDVMAIMAQRGDLILVSLLAPGTEAGLFAIASRLGRSLSIGQTAVFLAGADRFANLWTVRAVDELKALYQTLRRVGYIFGALMFIIVAAATPIVLRLFLPEASPAYLAVLFIAGGRLLSSGSGSAAQLLVMMDRPELEASAHSVSLVLLIAGAAVGAVLYGATGAAVAVLCADAVRARVLTHHSDKELARYEGGSQQ